MIALIIAAGMGNRLERLTSERPKALVPVANRELILRALDFVDHPSITDRIVVTGYQGELLSQFLQTHAPAVRTVHNPRFTDGSIITIQSALSLIDDDLLLMNVDHIYPKRLLPRLLEMQGRLSAVCDFDRNLVADDMKVKLTPTRTVARMSKQLTDSDGGYIGMTVIPRTELPRYREALDAARRTQGDKANAEAALDHLALEAYPIHICDASGIRWLEVDTPSDLADAEATLNTTPDFLL